MPHYDELNSLYAKSQFAEAAAKVYSYGEMFLVDAPSCTLAAAIMLALGELGEALPLLRRATELESRSAVTWQNYGHVLRQCGQPHQALAAYRVALGLSPGSSDLWLAAGDVLLGHADATEAALCFEEASRLSPGLSRAAAKLGLARFCLGDTRAAEAAYERALQLDPADIDTLINLGVLRHEGGDPASALDLYDRALVLDPARADAWSNRAKALRETHRLADAIGSFNHAVALRPDDTLLTLDRGMCRLLAGEFIPGWADLEARLPWTAEACGGLASIPCWHGGDVAGKRLLVTAEQGYGDTFQFMRYLTELRVRGAEVTLLVPPELVAVLDGLIPPCTVIGAPQRDDAFDAQVALLSLPHVFGTELHSIPSGIPYLKADAERAALWRSRLAGEGLRAGIVWQGNPRHRDDRNRSIKLQHFLTLAQIDGLRLISLQRRDGVDQLTADITCIERLPGVIDPDHAFLDLAAVIDGLDLVIAVDTAVAHLAGALGKPVWLLLPHTPCWRWLMERADTPWYPNMRLFRQHRPGDWGEVFSEVDDALRRLVMPSGN